MGQLTKSDALPNEGPPMLYTTGQNQQWPTSGLAGYITPAVWGVHNTSKRGTKARVVHK